MGEDVVRWEPNHEEDFLVASCYEGYVSLRTIFGPPCRYEEVKGIVLRSDVSFKIKAFGLRLVASRLPTKDLLVHKGISIPFDLLNCSFCGILEENRDHSFFGCRKVKNIWRDIGTWIGIGG